jgi:hypothetical protein
MTVGQVELSKRSKIALAAKAAIVLGRNSDGEVVKTGRGLYPHQWSWDTAFVATGLAAIDPGLACRNLDARFEGQWANGMVRSVLACRRSAGATRRM